MNLHRTILASAFTVTFAIFATAHAALAEKRVALVIGNSSYDATTDLKNPMNDARAISAKLDGMGFEVIEGSDLGFDALRDSIRSFARSARDADLTVFYYAGHGISVDGTNYIVPVDAKMDDPVDWEFEVYDVNEILRLVSRSNGPNLIFLDACRDNPMAQKLALAQGMSTRSMSTRGLSRIPTEKLGVTGSVIAYATEPGQLAADGDGANSPFATALLTHLDAENTDFASITSLITRDVLEMTDNVQRPRFDVSLTGPLIMNKVEKPAEQTEVAALDTTAPAAPAPNAAATIEVEKFMIESAQASGDVKDYEAYLSAFPNGLFAGIAQNAIDRLKEEQKEVEVAAATPTDGASGLTRYSGPLILNVTDPVRMAPASQATEAELGLSKLQRKQLQLRLNLSGNNVGVTDGAIGPGTRGGIAGWQTQNGLVPTGYLNALQHQLLTAKTEMAYVQHMQTNPNALNAPAPQRKKTVSSGGTQRRQQQNNTPDAGAFIGGVITGMGLNKIFNK